MDNVVDTHYLIDILALLLATVIIIPIFHRLRLGAILGYLTAGVILGPWGLETITTVDEIRHLGEFGVIFLLFILGIELKPEKLWRMRHLVLGLGLGQLLLTAAVLYFFAVWSGLSSQTAIVVGLGLALSSTAFCLQLLADRGGIATPMGRRVFSILLMQDLAVVPLLAFISFLAGSDATIAGEGFPFLYAIAIIIALLLAGHYLLNPILNKITVSKDSEVFIATAVLLVLGVAWIMEEIGLSMALGAFLAGLLLADSQYRHQIEADILPFRGILLGLFFMTVGMGVDFGLLADNFMLIIGLAVGLMIVKATIVYGLSYFSGAQHRVSIQAAVLLSQSGEFGFVLFGFAAFSGVLDAQLAQQLTLIIALSMAFTPFAVKLMTLLLQKPDSGKIVTEDVYTKFVEEEGHVILAGFGHVGARIGAILSAADVSYVAIDLDHERVKKAREQNYPVFFGDASNVKVLQAAGAEQAKMIVIALDNPDNFDRLVPLVRQYYPDIPIHARAKNRVHCANLARQGATTTVSETLETSLRLTEDILLGSEVDPNYARKVIDEFRDDYYSGVVQKMSEDKVVMGELKH